MGDRREEIESRLELLRSHLGPIPLGEKIEQSFNDANARSQKIEEITRLQNELDALDADR